MEALRNFFYPSEASQIIAGTAPQDSALAIDECARYGCRLKAFARRAYGNQTNGKLSLAFGRRRL